MIVFSEHAFCHAQCILFALKILMQALFFVVKCPCACHLGPTKLEKPLT